MAPILRALTLGLSVALAGALLASVPSIQALEETVGLTWLFKLRGPRTPPTDMVMVAIDEVSSLALGVPTDPRKWPRTLHARLVETLSRLGARSIVFDIHFNEEKSPEDDRQFAASLASYGRAVLFEYLKVDRPYAADAQNPELADSIHIERLIPPIPLLAEAAFALAPFPLPKVPARVSQAWLFKDGAGGIPTLAVLAHQIHNPTPHIRLCELVLMEDSDMPACARLVNDGPMTTPHIGQALRDRLLTDRALAQRVRQRIDREPVPDRSPLLRLVQLYEGPNHIYLDFYGPPQTVTTIPYHQILEPSGTLGPLVRGKTVFVGFSEQFKPEQRDGFFTVYSTSDGIDVSGVEIAATTFGNLQEGRYVHPLPLGAHYLIIACWGLVTGILLVSIPGLGAVVTALGAAVLWLTSATAMFSQSSLWLPVTVPLLFQLPLALTAALLWRYLYARTERKHLHEAFQYYIPSHVVDNLVKGPGEIGQQVSSVYGVCLSTDVDHFTKVAERLEPDDLRELLNRYFQTVFRPIKRFDGSVSDVVGDAIMAIWTAGPVDRPSTRRNACLAALSIQEAVTEFNTRHPESPLPTRIGLHSGQIALGNVGAEGHFEYRPVGDIVNASSRIEGLNKHLGTRVLVSESVLDGLTSFVFRDLGRFRVVGKDNPLNVFELIGTEEGVDTNRLSLCGAFHHALGEFRAQRWNNAADSFRALLDQFGDDGPTWYYLRLAERYAHEHPGAMWDGVINMSNK